MRLFFSQPASWILFFAMLGGFYFASVNDAGATDTIDYQSLERAGYGEVAQLLRQMTPEQRRAVLEEAEKKSRELKKMSPEERAQLEREMQQTYNKTDFSRVNVDKLDAKKSKSITETRSDMKAFREKPNPQK